MKFICTFFLLILFCSPLFSQTEKFVSAGLRLSDMPEHAFLDAFQDTFHIQDFQSRPSLKMGGGLKFLLSKKTYLEFELGYSINPFDFLKNRQIGAGTRDNTLKLESTHYAGFLGVLEFATHVNHTWGTKSNWELFAGIRFTSLYFNRLKGVFMREEFLETQDAMGNPQLVKFDGYQTQVGIAEAGISVRPLPEIGLRSWCLQKGNAGFEVHGGISLSRFFPKAVRLRAQFVGLSYVKRWK